MRVGLLTADLHHGHGWGHYSLSMAEALHAQGIDLVLIAPRNTPTQFPFPVHPLLPSVVPAEPRQLLKLIRHSAAVRAILQSCDVVHTLIEPYAPLAWLAAGKTPYLITGHGSYAQAGINRRQPVRLLHQRSFQHAERIVCVSHYTATRAEQFTSEIRTAVITNGVDHTRFQSLLRQPSHRPTLLTVGGVKRRKGTLPLVNAVAKVRQQIPDVRCIIIGTLTAEPHYVASVEAAIREQDLTANIELKGFVPEPELMQWYSQANVFVLPSINDGWKFEGYGLVHLEASAAGLPVIGTHDCGAADAIIDGETGLLVSQTHIAEELPQALLTLLSNQHLAEQFGAAGQQWANSQTWDAKARELITLYQTIS